MFAKINEIDHKILNKASASAAAEALQAKALPGQRPNSHVMKRLSWFFAKYGAVFDDLLRLLNSLKYTTYLSSSSNSNSVAAR